MLALAIAALAQAPPATHPSWCADANQTLYVNGTIQQSTTFHLCLDSTPGSLRWSRSVPGQVNQFFNGTYRFDVQGTSCTMTYFGPAQSTQMPWTMVQVDANATFNRTEHGYDGFKDVNVWTIYRPAKTQPVHIPAQEMEWRIENDSTGPVKEFLSSSCIQNAFPPSPPGLMQDGVRDFSGNYTTPAPPGSFSPPAGLTCKAAPGSSPFVPDSGCKPACASGSLCCRDPNLGPGNGTCFGVTSCDQIHGANLLTGAFTMPVEQGVFGD
jgi:hypothetical protein